MGDIIDLRAQLELRLAKGKPMLFVDHNKGTVNGTKNGPPDEFADRLARIRASLDKINKLMAELKNSEKIPIG